MQSEERNSNRWGVILAGGDGKRLLPLTRRITGQDTPKQFCALTGGETLLDQTRRRISAAIPESQTLIVVTETHKRFYAGQVADIPQGRLVEQPWNHGTAPAIAYALTRLVRLDPEGLVAFFPSDHHFGDDDAFTRQIERAFTYAQSDRERVVLLGISANAPEESYGWIEPGMTLGDSVFEVRRFWEKPARSVAKRLMRGGCLWNSFVMIGRVGAFLKLIRQTLPSLLEAINKAAGLAELYPAIPASNFSDEVLSANPSALAVLRADGLGWSDLGEPQRVLSMNLGQNVSFAFPGISGAQSIIW